MLSQGSSSRQGNDANDHQSTEKRDNTLDPRKVLEELAERAARYSINLDGSVSKDNVSCLRGGYATVHSGILQLNQSGVVIGGPATSASLGDGKTMKVDLLLNHTLPCL